MIIEMSYLEELERLVALRDQGIISDEEFATKDGQLLGLQRRKMKGGWAIQKD
jgi:hypothetical protein